MGNRDKGKDANLTAAEKQSVKDAEEPHARRVAPLKEGEKPDQLHKEHESEDRQEALLDEGIEESFPGSDPVSVKRIT